MVKNNFKNDFNDSPVLRSYARIAQEKGWIKNDPLQKYAQAESKLDLNPTINLTENVMKLCVGLRYENMEKEALELENNFLLYKQAQYNTSKEKGEDLIDQAHPKGGHQLEGVKGDAYVETILENHLKMINLINKKPSGKLGSTKDIIKSVKIVLADRDAFKQLENITTIYLQKLVPLFNTIKTEAEKHLTFEVSPKNITFWGGVADSALSAISPLSAPLTNEVFSSNLKDLVKSPDKISEIESFWSRTDSSLKFRLGDLYNLVSTELEQGYAIINIAKETYEKAKDALNAPAEVETSTETPSTETSQNSGTVSPPNLLKPLFDKLNGLIYQVKSWSVSKQIRENPRALAWINKELKDLTDIQERYGSIPGSQEAYYIKSMSNDIATEANYIADFQSMGNL